MMSGKTDGVLINHRGWCWFDGMTLASLLTWSWRSAVHMVMRLLMTPGHGVNPQSLPSTKVGVLPDIIPRFVLPYIPFYNACENP